MAFFNFLKSNKGLKIELKLLGNFETTSSMVRVRVTMTSRQLVTIDKLQVRLRADPTKKRGTARILGDAELPRAISLAADKSGSLEFTLPVDFGPIDDFDIPPENLAMASAEMKAAAAANRTANYKYSVEATYKTTAGVEQTVVQSIRLVQPNEVRAG